MRFHEQRVPGTNPCVTSSTGQRMRSGRSPRFTLTGQVAVTFYPREVSMVSVLPGRYSYSSSEGHRKMQKVFDEAKKCRPQAL